MWIDEFVKLQFPVNPDDMQTEEAQRLKFEQIPKSLYRFRQFNNHSIENLLMEREWQSYPCEFNDPFDSRLKIDMDIAKKEIFFKLTWSEFLKSLKKQDLFFSNEELDDIYSSTNPIYTTAKYIAKYDRNYQDKEEEFAKFVFDMVDKELKRILDPFRTAIQTGYFIVCYSEVKERILMWSYYAKDHSGFCIEYNFKELGPLHPLSRILHPVIYTDELFDATYYLINPLVNNHRTNNLFGIYPSISKGREWAHEREWRTVYPFGPNARNEDRFIKVPCPKNIYVGSKASTENINRLREISEIKKISLYQMHLDEDSHMLHEQLIYSPLGY